MHDFINNQIILKVTIVTLTYLTVFQHFKQVVFLKLGQGFILNYLKILKLIPLKCSIFAKTIKYSNVKIKTDENI